MEPPSQEQITNVLKAAQTIMEEGGPSHAVVHDLPALKGLVEEAKLLRRVFLDEQVRYEERSSGWFDRVASFFEKVAFTDGLIIASSLTLIGFLLQHSGGHLPRKPFEFLVCPAWILLIFSVYACAMQISRLHIIRGRLLALVRSQQHSLLFTELSELLDSLKEIIEPKADSPDVRRTIKVAQDGLMALFPSDAIVREHEQIKSIGEKKGWAYAATISTMVAVLLLCVFSMRALLIL